MTDLDEILRGIAPKLDAGSYVFTTIDKNAPVPLTATSMMREGEGTSLVMRERDANALGLPMTFPCRLITLTVDTSLYSVGLLATIANDLADAGISLSAVSGFHHVHVFVPIDRAEEALEILERLSTRAH
ncbi:MAG: ACT domain-containing protein [Candidatus Eremiobacteraeota bacterium]|nr:ACT domain-containing protein [Candidatus Eremiobacteraeota bacterium]